MPKLTINGAEIEVAPGTSILQAAEALGIEIPRFCYHDRLSVPANCRMCLVEVEGGPPKPVASCAMPCADKMVVKTESEMVRKARRGVMEMLLINHPLDCPICDQGGECDLQDQAMGYGFDRSRYHENKRAVPDKDFGPLIKTSMTRCIQCTRCVRFGEEIGGVPDLGLLNRGEDVEISTFIGKAVGSELSGNMIDICPVGALTSKPYAFKARPWELRKTETIDVHDAVGSNIRVDSRGNEVLRVLPRVHEGINEVWISDKTRFACDGLSRRRLDRPWLRENGKLREASWDEAFAAVAAALRAAKPEKMAALAGDLCAVEEMVAIKDLLGPKAHYECRVSGESYDVSVRGNYLFNSTIAGIEQADAILLVGTNPRLEAAIINARIRKNWVNRRIKIGLIGPAADLSYPYTHLGERIEAQDKDVRAFLEKAGKPILIAGMGAFRRGDGTALHAALIDLCESHNMTFNMLHTAAARVGALDTGFSADGDFDLSKMDFVYLLGADDFDPEQISAKSFVVYQGHHGDAGAHRADVILPGAAYTEKEGIYVNTEGRVQSARRAVSPPGDAREDWKIIRALSDHVARKLPYDNLVQLRARIVKEWPHMGQRDIITPAAPKKFRAGGGTARGPFEPVFGGYYLTNVICRASATMMKCVDIFVNRAERAGAREAAE